jgi:hypothetical protein
LRVNRSELSKFSEMGVGATKVIIINWTVVIAFVYVLAKLVMVDMISQYNVIAKD